MALASFLHIRVPAEVAVDHTLVKNLRERSAERAMPGGTSL